MIRKSVPVAAVPIKAVERLILRWQQRADELTKMRFCSKARGINACITELRALLPATRK